MQVFCDRNGTSWRISRPFPSFLLSYHRSPSRSCAETPPFHFGHCKHSHACSEIPIWTYQNQYINVSVDVYAHGMQVILTLATAAGAAAAAIVYLAQNGNPNTNWLSICDQFGNFCQSMNGAVVASFVTVVVLMSLILLSAFALKKN